MDEKILIVSSKNDVHSDAVIQQLKKGYGTGSVVRINTEDIASNARASFRGSKIFVELEDSGKQIDSEAVTAVWFRRPKPVAISEGYPDSAKQFIRDEWTAFIRGLYFCTHDTALWVNPLPSLHRARNKMQQLQLAMSLGLNVPDTLVSNIPTDIFEFHDRNEKVCMKTLERPSYKLGPNRFAPIYTKVVSKEYCEDNIASLMVAPVIFQEFIRKAYDARIVIIGDNIYAFSITPKTGSKAEIDFRHGLSEGMSYDQITLDTVTKEKILRFVGQQGLNFSAIDMVVDVYGKIWFLENNPNGQWLWLEHATRCELSKAMAAHLMTGKKNRPTGNAVNLITTTRFSVG